MIAINKHSGKLKIGVLKRQTHYIQNVGNNDQKTYCERKYDLKFNQNKKIHIFVNYE